MEKYMSKDSGSCKAVKTTKPANHNKRWSETDEKYLVTNYASGASADLIARELNRTVVSVLGRLATLGLVEFDKKENAYYRVRAKLYQF
jgi:chromosome condensin MukBEF MukE localization factor